MTQMSVLMDGNGQHADHLPNKICSEHDEWQWPDANMLAASLGYLASEEGVDVLLATFVDTNWAEPQSKQPYALFIDQGPLMFPQKYVWID